MASWRIITRHTTDAGFSLSPSGSSRDLLISSATAMDSVKLAFSRDALDREKVGSAPRSISYPMDSSPLMQSLFKFLHNQDCSNLQAVIDHDFSALSMVLVDFKPLVGVLFYRRLGGFSYLWGLRQARLD